MITLENTKGYILQKQDLSEKEIIKIKNDLTVTPKISSEYVKTPESFKIFHESKKYIYLPRFYGRKNFGYPKINKLDVKNIAEPLLHYHYFFYLNKPSYLYSYKKP